MATRDAFQIAVWDCFNNKYAQCRERLLVTRKKYVSVGPKLNTRKINSCSLIRIVSVWKAIDKKAISVWNFNTILPEVNEGETVASGPGQRNYSRGKSAGTLTMTARYYQPTKSDKKKWKVIIYPLFPCFMSFLPYFRSSFSTSYLNSTIVYQYETLLNHFFPSNPLKYLKESYYP